MFANYFEREGKKEADDLRAKAETNFKTSE